MAQLKPSVRLELATNSNLEESFDVTPLGTEGVLVTVRHGDYYSSQPVKFSFQRYDTDLKPIWQSEHKIDSYFEPVRSCQTAQFQYWLLRESGGDHIQILRVNLADGQTELFKGNLLTQVDVLTFRILDNVAYIGGNYRNRPMVLVFSFFDQTSKVLPGLYNNHIQLNDIQVDEQQRVVHVMTDATHQRNCDFTIHTYSYEGKLLNTINLDGATNSLISGKLLPINNEEALLVGNYSTDCTPYSQGIYVTRIRNGEALTKETRYVSFADLKNFFNYMKPKRQQRMMDRIVRRKTQGKDTKFRYRLLVHDLIPTADGLMLLAEVYYPQYKGSTNSMMFTGGLRSFDRFQDGYRYTHAFLCGIDNRGQLLWDNCLPIKDLSSFELHPMVQASRQDDLTVLAYPQDGEITMEVLQGNKVLPEKQALSLKKLVANEKVLYSEDEQLAAWYDQHFLAFGFQKITPERSSAPPREVFYLNKLTYRLDKDGKPIDSASDDGQPTRKTSGSER